MIFTVAVLGVAAWRVAGSVSKLRSTLSPLSASLSPMASTMMVRLRSPRLKVTLVGLTV